MKKKHFALIGHPISHSMSAFINKKLFEISNFVADYDLINIPPEDLGCAFKSLKELDGFNVTLPHKQSIIHYLDELSQRASLYKTVNVVKNENNVSTGYITDSEGFIRALEVSNIALEGKVVIIGAGGAARAAAYEAAFAGCDTIIAVRPQSLNSVASLVGDIKNSVISPLVSSCTIESLLNEHSDIDLLINATPAGMYPGIDNCPVSEDVIRKCNAVFDMIYNPKETKFIKIAKENDVKYSNGLYMLIFQAVCAHKIWTGADFSMEDIKQLYLETNAEINKTFSGVLC